MANKNTDTKLSSCNGSFDWDFHFLANLFFIHHHLQDSDACAEKRKIWLHAKFTREFEKQCTPEEKLLAAEFTNYERNKSFDWNDNGFVDYESAISAFISIKGGKPEYLQLINICLDRNMDVIRKAYNEQQKINKRIEEEIERMKKTAMAVVEKEERLPQCTHALMGMAI